MGDIMNRLIIYEYINRLKKEDIIKYCNIKDIDIKDYELDIIYRYIKTNYKRFFNDPISILDEVKSKVSDKTFKEIVVLYDKYKDRL